MARPFLANLGVHGAGMDRPWRGGRRLDRRLCRMNGMVVVGMGGVMAVFTGRRVGVHRVSSSAIQLGCPIFTSVSGYGVKR